MKKTLQQFKARIAMVTMVVMLAIAGISFAQAPAPVSVDAAGNEYKFYRQDAVYTSVYDLCATFTVDNYNITFPKNPIFSGFIKVQGKFKNESGGYVNDFVYNGTNFVPQTIKYNVYDPGDGEVIESDFLSMTINNYSPKWVFDITNLTTNNSTKREFILGESYTLTLQYVWNNPNNILDFMLKDYTTAAGAAMQATFIYGAGAVQPLPVAPEIPHMDFEGWYKDETLTQRYNEDTITGDISLFPKYVYKKYTVTFNSNEGTAVDSITQDALTTITEPTPMRTGFTFKGWYTDEALTAAYNFAAPLDGNKTLYAKWEIIMCKVTFYDNAREIHLVVTVPYGTKLAEAVADIEAQFLLSLSGYDHDAVIEATALYDVDTNLNKAQEGGLKVGGFISQHWLYFAIGGGILVIGLFATLISVAKKKAG